MKMKKGDWVYTRRFEKVQIEEVFETMDQAFSAGYKVIAYSQLDNYVVVGKNIDKYEMVFAAYKKAESIEQK